MPPLLGWWAPVSAGTRAPNADYESVPYCTVNLLYAPDYFNVEVVSHLTQVDPVLESLELDCYDFSGIAEQLLQGRRIKVWKLQRCSVTSKKALLQDSAWS